jgi:hypothetical protein
MQAEARGASRQAGLLACWRCTQSQSPRSAMLLSRAALHLGLALQVRDCALARPSPGPRLALAIASPRSASRALTGSCRCARCDTPRAGRPPWPRPRAGSTRRRCGPQTRGLQERVRCERARHEARAARCEMGAAGETARRWMRSELELEAERRRRRQRERADERRDASSSLLRLLRLLRLSPRALVLANRRSLSLLRLLRLSRPLGRWSWPFGALSRSCASCTASALALAIRRSIPPSSSVAHLRPPPPSLTSALLLARTHRCIRVPSASRPSLAAWAAH